MDLDECEDRGLVKREKRVRRTIKSLVETSAIKQEVVTTSKITERNVTAYFPLAYESLREILEAVALSFEYKVLSHECMGELLNLILEDFDIEFFNTVRKIRNGINYYGKSLEFKRGISMISRMLSMRDDLVERYL